MNLPNKLTVLRVILIPFFVVALLAPIPGGKYIATAIFIIASLTDLLDGKIARKYNLVTNFGKFMDPLADKLLVSSALICLCTTISDYNGKIQIPVWIVLIIIAREFIISGFRLVASDNGIVIAAGMWGKVKTAVTMVTIIAVILDFNVKAYYIAEQVLIYLSLVLTVISLFDYLIHNKSVLSEESTNK